MGSWRCSCAPYGENRALHLKRYKPKMSYQYMILESGTNTGLVNLGCVSLREAPANSAL